MTPIRCEDFYDSLDQWLEGRQTPEAAKHLSECARCRVLVEELAALSAAAPALAAADPEPPERLWISLRAELVNEGLIHEDSAGDAVRDAVRDTVRDTHPAKPGRAATWLDEIFAAIPRPALAGAYLAAILAVSLAVVGPLRQHFGENRFAGAVLPAESPINAQLASDEQDAVATLADANPAVTASLQNSLAVVDNNIALCEKSLREDPTSEATRDYLFEAYQQKADLLDEISERGVSGR